MRNVKFAFVDISKQVNMNSIVEKYTNHLWERKAMVSPSILIYGRDKNDPVDYTGSKFSFNINDYIKNYCNNNGYKV